jgi:hypothetical protein
MDPVSSCTERSSGQKMTRNTYSWDNGQLHILLNSKVLHVTHSHLPRQVASGCQVHMHVQWILEWRNQQRFQQES